MDRHLWVFEDFETFGDTKKTALARHGRIRFDVLDACSRTLKPRTNCPKIVI